VGSSYGPKMRSDELIARMIIFALKKRKFIVRSPYAERIWTYSKDVMAFYDRLLSVVEKLGSKIIGKRLICAGNKEDEPITNIKLAELMNRMIGLEYEEGEYEPGEVVNGKPVRFIFYANWTRDLLNWKPKYSLEEGLRETIEWFKENIEKYV